MTGPHPVDPDTDFTYTGIYQTICINKEVIETKSMGPAFTRKGAAYNDPVTRDMLHGPSLNPDKKEGPDKVRVNRNKAVREMVEDLDDWGQRLHHYRSASPGHHEDSPGRQMTIYNSIRARLHKIEVKHDINDKRSQEEKVKIAKERALLIDYPLELKKSEDARLIAVHAAENRLNRTRNEEKWFNMRMAEWSHLPKDIKNRTPRPTKMTGAEMIATGRLYRYRSENNIRPNNRLLTTTPTDDRSGMAEFASDERFIEAITAPPPRETLKQRRVSRRRQAEEDSRKELLMLNVRSPSIIRNENTSRQALEYVPLDDEDLHGVNSNGSSSRRRREYGGGDDVDTRPVISSSGGDGGGSSKRAKVVSVQRKKIIRASAPSLVLDSSMSGFED
jgi:hypothetical protein